MVCHSTGDQVEVHVGWNHGRQTSFVGRSWTVLILSPMDMNDQNGAWTESSAPEGIQNRSVFAIIIAGDCHRVPQIRSPLCSHQLCWDEPSDVNSTE